MYTCVEGKAAYGEAVAEHVGALDERGLVRTRGLVGDLAVLGLGDDGVARGEEKQELVDDAGRLVATGEVRAHLGEAEDLATLALLDRFDVRDPADRALLEVHLVARERARLVAKDVFDLPELLDERRCAAERGRVGRRVDRKSVV